MRRDNSLWQHHLTYSLAIATNQLAIHRFQLAVVTAIAVVFAVIGVDDNIYTGVSARVAVGAGWLLIAIVDVSIYMTCGF